MQIPSRRIVLINATTTPGLAWVPRTARSARGADARSPAPVRVQLWPSVRTQSPGSRPPLPCLQPCAWIITRLRLVRLLIDRVVVHPNLDLEIHYVLPGAGRLPGGFSHAGKPLPEGQPPVPDGVVSGKSGLHSQRQLATGAEEGEAGEEQGTDDVQHGRGRSLGPRRTNDLGVDGVFGTHTARRPRRRSCSVATQPVGAELWSGVAATLPWFFRGARCEDRGSA